MINDQRDALVEIWECSSFAEASQLAKAVSEKYREEVTLLQSPNGWALNVNSEALCFFVAWDPDDLYGARSEQLPLGPDPRWSEDNNLTNEPDDLYYDDD